MPTTSPKPSGDRRHHEEEKVIRDGLKIVDISHLAESEALDRAQHVIHEETGVRADWGMMNRLKRGVSHVWKEMTKNYRRNKELRRVRAKIQTEQHLYAGKGGDDRSATDAMDSQRATQALLERFDESYDQEALRDGESLEVHTGNEDENVNRLRESVFALISQYGSTSEMTDADFLIKKREIYDGFFHDKERVPVSLYADNALEMAHAVRAGSLHIDRLEEIEKVTIGRARSKYKTEAQYTMVDRAVDFLHRSPLTDKIPPSIITVGVAAAIGVGKVAQSMATRLARAVTFGLGGAAVVGLTRAAVENQKLKAERAETARSVARGEQFGHEAVRRAKMAEFVMEMKSAGGFVNEFTRAYCDEAGNLRADLTPEQLSAAVSDISEMETRIRFSHLSHVDTVSYGGDESESLHTKLMLTRARAKVQLRNRLGLDREAFETRLQNDGRAYLDSLQSEKNEKDQLEKTYRRKQVLRAGLKGAAFGLVGGLAVQEATAFVNDDVEGLAEHHLFHHGSPMSEHETTLAGLFDWGNDQEITPGTVSTKLSLLDVTHESMIYLPGGGDLTLKLPSGFDLIYGDGGAPMLRIPGGQELVLEVDSSTGGLTQETQNQLRAAGLSPMHEHFDLELQSHVATTETTETTYTTTTHQISGEEYLKNRAMSEPGWYQRDKRPIWLGNDTPMYQDAQGRWHGADFNELRAYLAGENRTGFSADGSAGMKIDMKEFRVDAQGDQAAGSIHRGLIGKPAQAIKEGRMFWELTPVKGGPTFQVPFTVGPDGNVTAQLSPDHPVYQMCLRPGPDGKLIRGAYLSEIVEHPTDGGRPLIYASGRGKVDLGDVRYTEQTPVETVRSEQTPVETFIPNNEITITKSVSVTETTPETVLAQAHDVVPFLPVYSGRRKELEKVMMWGLDYEYLSGGALDPERQRLYEERRSRTLHENPVAILDHYKEAKAYFKNFTTESLKETKSLAEQITEPMGDQVKIAVCIPVAGHQEGKNIYESLKNFSRQTLSPEQYEIVLLVNHPDRDKTGKKVVPDETLTEIARFKTEHPEISVRVMYQVFPIEKANIGQIRKLLNDATLYRHHTRGKGAPDLVLVSNDADNKGISPNYLESFLERFESDPRTEGILGQLEWDPAAYTKYPEVYVGTELFRYINGVGRKRWGGMASSGANFAFRSSIYAGIGGYIPGMPGEDIAMGQMIVSARKNWEPMKYERRALVYTSARRSVDAFKKGLAPLEQWEAGFGAFDELRKHTLERDAELNFDDLDVRQKIKANLTWVINRTLDAYESGDKLGKDAHLYKRVIAALGILYRLDDHGDVVIGDISGLIERLKKMQKLAVLQRDMKSGQPDAKRKYLEALEQYKSESERQALAAEQAMHARYTAEAEPLVSDTTVIRTGLPKAFATKAELEVLPSKEEVGEYVVVHDKVLFKGVESGSAIKAAYRNDSDGVYVYKESAKASLDYHKEMPEGVSDPESYVISQGVTHPNLLLPEKRYDKGDNIARFYEAGAKDLFAYVQRDGKKFEPKEAIVAMLKISSAIDALHRIGVVHADLAPGNILLTGNEVKVLDLDGAAIQEGNAFYRKKIRGNRFAAAPEMLRETGSGVIKFDKTVDIYAASSILYWMLVQNWPYQIKKLEPAVIDFADDEERLNEFYTNRLQEYRKLHEKGEIVFPDVIPTALRAVIAKGMSPYPKERYQSMEEFSLALVEAYRSI